MCAILGILLADTNGFCRQEIFDALTVLQHRGQDAAGIVTGSTDGFHTRFHQVKGCGMVRDVFGLDDMLSLQGNVGVGHCRYPTAGNPGKDSAQPMYSNFPCGLAFTHNGNLTNKAELQAHVMRSHRHLTTQSDSEVLLNVFAEELRMQIDSRDESGSYGDKISIDNVFNAVQKTMKLCRGGYACTVLIHDVGMLAFRDPWGIRPIVVGSRDSSTIEGGVDYIFASESAAVDTLGFKLIRDLKPGECILTVPMKRGESRPDLGFISRQLVSDGTKLTPCLFEYVYFARPDSIMNGVSVHEARMRMGKKLAKKIRRVFPNERIDVVIPIPDTSRPCALACANELGLPFRDGFVKNSYIGRTFIMPEQASRKRSVRLKLNTVKSEFENRNVLLVDDSVVRGTTSGELVRMAREAKAAKVFFCSASPEIRYPNVYGIDLPVKDELIAYNRALVEISEVIGCDWVLYNDLLDLEESIRELNPDLDEFETSTFTGKYITDDVDESYFKELERERNDHNKVSCGYGKAKREKA